MSSFYRIMDGPDDLKLRFCQQLLVYHNDIPSITLKICPTPCSGLEKGHEAQVDLWALWRIESISDSWEFEGIMNEKKVRGLYTTGKRMGNLSVSEIS